MSTPDYDPRGNKDVGDISEPEYGSSLTRIVEWIYELVRWLRQREPVTPGDPFTKFATRGYLVQKGLLTEGDVLGDDNEQPPDDDVVEPQYVVVHAREMYPSATAGATGPTSDEITSAKPNIQYIEFSAVGDTSAEFQLIMPFGWPGNAFQFRCYWSHPTGATTYGVSWKLQAHSATDQEAIGSDFADGGYVDDDGGTTDTLYITAESSPITISGVNAKAGDLIFLRITRNRTGSAHDDMNVPARLHAIRFNLGEAPVEFPPPASAGELYLRFEGGFTDSSAAARTVTSVSSPALSASHPGGGAQGFVGNGAGHLTVVDDGWADIGTRIFQIRFHLYVATSATLATDNIICGKWGASDGSWFVNLYGVNGRLNWGRKNGSYFFDAITNAAIPRDTLVQVTIWRHTVNGQIFCALDGVTQTPGSAGGTHDTTTNNFAFGAVVGGGAPLPAGVYVDEFQFKIDETDYPTSASFTPPTPPYA